MIPPVGPNVISFRNNAHRFTIPPPRPPDDADDPDEPAGAALPRPSGDRHEVDDLADPGRAEETGDEDVGVREVELLVRGPDVRRRDLEATADPLVQDRREDA